MSTILLRDGDIVGASFSAIPLVSIVISNFNYADYLASAIDSALKLDWPLVEVIVVDDGSTDASRPIIDSYGSQIVALYQDNRGHTGACNSGFSLTHGDLIIFLDADDVLDPTILREMVPFWRPGVSKLQCQMRIIDGAGRPTGAVLPQYGIHPTPELIRRWVLRSAAYPTPPGSGNIYARDFLKCIFPLDETERASDSHCLAAAPYFGWVVTVAKPLVSYRVHGRNDGAMATLDATRFGRELARAHWRFAYAQTIAKSRGISVPDTVFGRSMTLLAYRLASLRLAPATHPHVGDSIPKILRATVAAFFVPQGLTLAARTAFVAWGISVSLSPTPIAKTLILWRFAPASRPVWLQRLLGGFRVVGRESPIAPVADTNIDSAGVEGARRQ